MDQKIVNLIQRGRKGDIKEIQQCVESFEIDEVCFRLSHSWKICLTSNHYNRTIHCYIACYASKFVPQVHFEDSFTEISLCRELTHDMCAFNYHFLLYYRFQIGPLVSQSLLRDEFPQVMGFFLDGLTQTGESHQLRYKVKL